MNGLFVLYSALAVFGVGVTVIDFLGIFEQSHDAGSPSQGDDGDDGGDGGDDDGGAIDDGGDDGVGNDESTGDDDATDDASVDDDASGLGDAHGTALSAREDGGGSHIASVDSATRIVARAIGTLRLGVYFSLGAGPTGLFSILTGVAPLEGLAWSSGAGVFVAVIAKALRRLVRRDLDSSIRPEEFIMDEAEVTVPILPGAMGKAVVRRYGRETELYVRAKDARASFPKGSRVRISDFDDDCYWIESP